MTEFEFKIQNKLSGFIDDVTLVIRFYNINV